MIAFLIVISILGYLALGVGFIKLASQLDDGLMYNDVDQFTLGIFTLIWPVFAAGLILIGSLHLLGLLVKKII
jgi:hypothetical protein